MKTVKLSWSILHAWERGDFEQAVGYYLGKKLPITPAMELGSLKHKVWENYTNMTGELHTDFGGGKLTKPLAEKKYQLLIPYSDDMQILLRGIIDLEHVENGEVVLEDYKCGGQKAGAYISKLQLDYYKLFRPEATVGKIRAFNPYTKEVTVGVKFLNEKSTENALEHIMTYGGEMISYLETQKLLIDYKKL